MAKISNTFLPKGDLANSGLAIQLESYYIHLIGWLNKIKMNLSWYLNNNNNNFLSKFDLQFPLFPRDLYKESTHISKTAK